MNFRLLPLFLAGILALSSCGKKSDDPQALTAAAGAAIPSESPAIDVTSAPTAPAGTANVSQMQVRVYSTGLGTLQSSVIIHMVAEPDGATNAYQTYVYGFNGNMNQRFNIGSMAQYQAGGLVYHYEIEVRIKDISSTTAIPVNANMWVELLKNGQVVATNRVPASAGLPISVEWRTNPAFLYSGFFWNSH